jgi:hypothetical protein
LKEIDQTIIEPSKSDRSFDDYGLEITPLLERCQHLEGRIAVPSTTANHLSSVCGFHPEFVKPDRLAKPNSSI